MKKFAGFTPQQQYTLLTRQGYEGPPEEQEMAKFISSNPGAASKMGDYARMAQERLAGPPPGEVPEMFLGGLFGGKAQKRQKALEAANLATAQTTATEAQANFEEQAAKMPEGAAELQGASVNNPMDIVTPATVTQAQAAPGTEIAAGTGDAGAAQQANASTVTDTATAAAPETQAANTVTTQTVSQDVNQALDGTQAAQGMVSEAGTVRGQLTSLMKDFENDGTPPWASGAMRQAMGAMQARGLGASSVAGQAIVQAAMESAIGIASQDAATTAQFEMQNLNNEQQMTIFKTQQRIAGLFSDQAAENASQQFNASSKNQTDQFFASLQTNVAQFNAQQVNAIRQFNAGEENAVEQFNAQQVNLRDQFNAQNSLVIAQANAQWRQNLELTNTAAQNEANMMAAKTANGFTQSALDNIWQRERDLLAFAFTSAESAEDRYYSLMVGNQQASAQRAASKGAGIGKLLGTVAGAVVGGPAGAKIGGSLFG